jgi:hypothetical protein
MSLTRRINKLEERLRSEKGWLNLDMVTIADAHNRMSKRIDALETQLAEARVNTSTRLSALETRVANLQNATQKAAPAPWLAEAIRKQLADVAGYIPATFECGVAKPDKSCPYGVGAGLDCIDATACRKENRPHPRCVHMEKQSKPQGPRKYATAYEMAHPEIGRMCAACMGVEGSHPGNSCMSGWLKKHFGSDPKPHLFTPDLVGREIEWRNDNSRWARCKVLRVVTSGQTAIVKDHNTGQVFGLCFTTEWRLVPAPPVLRVGQWVRWISVDEYHRGKIAKQWPDCATSWLVLPELPCEVESMILTANDLEPAVAFDSNGIALWPGDVTRDSFGYTHVVGSGTIDEKALPETQLHKRAVKPT